MRIHLEAMLSGIMLVGTVGVQAQNLAEDGNGRALLSTAVTGSINASGLGDPQYVLSFVPVQHLMIEAIRHPLTQMEIQKAIQTTPVTLDHLLQLELLRKEGDIYRLNYLLLTIQDQQAMYRASERYGQSLAEAFRLRKADFDEFVNRYPNVALRPQLMFDLVAGAALNWGGLELTTDLGYRVQPPRHANGDVYLVHSKQVGAQLDFAGLYLDSETAPGSKMSFSTFGDGVSMPRLQGLPDVLDDAFDTAMDPWRNLPEVYAALRSEYLALLMLAIHDAGQVMNAVADGTDTDTALAKALPVPEDRRRTILGLLTATGYLREMDHRYRVGVPVLTLRDKPLVDATLKLSREIMTKWLRRNYAGMEKDLSGLSPMRNGLPFSLVFSEVWHYAFGFATKSLAESGFYANPLAPGNRYEGYVPLVWENSVLTGPGNSCLTPGCQTQ